MSTSYAFRVDGTPYLAAMIRPFSGIPNADAPVFDTSSALGVLLLDVALFALPNQRSGGSGTEEHPLFSYHEFWPGIPSVLAHVGVTPLGALTGRTTMSATPFQSAPGLMVANGQFRKIAFLFGYNDVSFREWSFVGGSGTSWQYGATLAASTSYGSSAIQIGPATGRDGIVMLFNGMLGQTSCACAIRHAILSATNSVLYWPIDDARGTTLRDSPATYNTVPYTYEGDLTYMQYDPRASAINSLPWGPPPPDDSVLHGQWMLHTDYTRRAFAKTVYARRYA